MKKKILLSALTVVMLVSLMITATFALFTSGANFTGNKVKAGKVDLQAALSLSDRAGEDPLVSDAENTAISVENGSRIVMNNVAPGDKGYFKLAFVNNSSIKTKYVTAIVPSQSDASLYSALTFTGISWTASSDIKDLEWKEIGALQNPADVYFAVEFNKTAGNEYAEKSFSFDIFVFAVQSNGAESVRFATSVAELNAAQLGETVVLAGDIESAQTVFLPPVNLNVNGKTLSVGNFTMADDNFAGTVGIDMSKGGSIACEDFFLNLPKTTVTILGQGFTLDEINADTAKTADIGYTGTFTVNVANHSLHLNCATVAKAEKSAGAVSFVSPEIKVMGESKIEIKDSKNDIKFTIDENAKSVTIVNDSEAKIVLNVPVLKDENAAVNVVTQDTSKVEVTGDGASKTEITDKNEIPAGAIEIKTAEELSKAIMNQKDGQLWIVYPGTYDIPRSDFVAGGRTGWHFPISASNLTIKGIGKPVLTSSVYSENGIHQNQNFITVFGNNVTIDNFVVKSKMEANKSIEILGKSFALKNTLVACNDLVSYESYLEQAGTTAGADDDYYEYYTKHFSGSVYFNGDAGDALVENVRIEKSGLATIGVKAGQITVRDTYIDNVGCQSSSPAISASSNTYMKVEGLTIRLGAEAMEESTLFPSFLQETFNRAPSGAKIVLSGNTEFKGSEAAFDWMLIPTLTISRGITLSCENGATLTGLVYLNAENIVFDGVDFRYTGKDTIYGNLIVNADNVTMKNSSFYAKYTHKQDGTEGTEGDWRFGLFQLNKANFVFENNVLESNAMGIFGIEFKNTVIRGNTFRNAAGYTAEERTVALNSATMLNAVITGNVFDNRHIVLGGSATITGNTFKNRGQNGTKKHVYYFFGTFTGTISGNAYGAYADVSELAKGEASVTIPEIG